MAQYLVSARKYRPTKFTEVVGQQHITTTIKNSLKNEQVAQSFLFCGPRGVGKTTCARILAKVLNCENKSEDFEPCNKCNSCTSFNENASFNIFELDAASNNSVEDIRQLIEQVRFAPQTGKYKVYIIDEVHMLSLAAFNAFLKTLEEPPTYAIFILATTEKHKLLPTIISRCQVFDFQRIKNQDIVEHLAYIAKEEKIDADAEALHIIAQKADGGLRDALSIYDRMSSFANGEITYQSVLENLNVLDYEYFFKITDNIQLQDRSALMLTLDEILRNGFDGAEFINGLSSHLRNLLMAKAPNTVSILEVSENWKAKYQQQAQALSTGFVLSCLNLANECALSYRDASNKRLQIELALLKMCFVNQAVDLSKKKIEAPALTSNQTQTQNIQQTVQQVPTPKPPIQQPINTPKPEVKIQQAPIVEETKPAIEKPKTNKFAFKTGSGGENMKLGGSLDSISKNIKEDLAEKVKPILEYTQQNIAKLWNDFVGKNESPRIKGMLFEHEFTLNEKVFSTITNSTFNEAELKTELKRFIEGLKEDFDGVELQYNVAYVKPEESNKPKKAYTLEDKFKQMAEKNPNIETLRNELGLELEY